MTDARTNSTPPHGAIALTAAVLAGLIVAVAITLGLAAGFDWTGAWPAVAIAAGVGIFAILTTLPLLLLVVSKVSAADADGLIKLSSAVMAAGLIRMIVVAVGIIVPVKLYDAAPWPTLGFVAIHYVLLTLAEVGVLGRLFWRKDSESPAPPKVETAEDSAESPAAPSPVR